MATLYVRNLPSDLYDDLCRWADKGARSINAEVIDILRREAERRSAQTELAGWYAAYRAKYGGKPVDSDVVSILREHRYGGELPVAE